MTTTSGAHPYQPPIGDSCLPTDGGASCRSDNLYSGPTWATVPGACADADADKAVSTACAVLFNRVVAPCMAFGGAGSNGRGRESGLEAVNYYTETKSIWIKLDGPNRDPVLDELTSRFRVPAPSGGSAHARTPHCRCRHQSGTDRVLRR